jgi:CsbD-like protein
MDWNRIEGNWKQFKGQAKEKWGRLTDDDLDVINGRQDRRQDLGTLRPCQGSGQEGCRDVVQVAAVNTQARLAYMCGNLNRMTPET